MNIMAVKTRDTKKSYDTRVVLCFKDMLCSKAYYEKEIFELAERLINSGDFKGEADEVVYVNQMDSKLKKVVFCGLGERDKLDMIKLKKSVGKAVKECSRQRCKRIEIVSGNMSCSIDAEAAAVAVIETFLAAEYCFDKYLQKKKSGLIEEITVVLGENFKGDADKVLNEGSALGRFTSFARDLINEPANVMIPEKLAEEAQKAGRENGFEVKVLEEDEIDELGMHAFLEVSMGSINPPRFIIMKYKGNPEQSNKVLGIAGKGLTYDSGGYSIKTGNGMINMRTDMAGGAAAIGAMCAIASNKLKVNVTAVVAACENMISGYSYRPGDIINSMAGKTIFIKSTDAEGRLTLADAVYYLAEKENVSSIIDIATLTGAAGRAYGKETTAVVTNSDELYSKLVEATNLSAERVWQAPSFEEYKAYLKNDYADLVNSTDGPGMIVAGLFIEEFVKSKPWLHLDIAATAFNEKGSGYFAPGGTGVGVKTLYYYAAGEAQKNY